MDHSGQPGNYYVEKSDPGHSPTNNWTKTLLIVVPVGGSSLQPGERTSFGLFAPDSQNNTVIQFYAKTNTSSDNNVLYVHDLGVDESTGDVVPLQEF